MTESDLGSGQVDTSLRHADVLRPIKRVLFGYKSHAYLTTVKFFDSLEHKYDLSSNSLLPVRTT